MRVLLLVLAGLAAGLLIAEGAARIGERVRCQDLKGGFAVRNRLYGWGNRPGASVWNRGCVDFRTHVHINRHGLRDREISYARSAAARILVLGDSFTAGIGVDRDQTYVKLLERRLTEGAAADAQVEVLNAGVPGWGTDNALLYYRHEGWKYHPDLVLLAFDTLNDPFENTRRMVAMNPFWPDKPYFALEDGFALRNFPLAPQPVRRAVLAWLAGGLQRHSALFRLASSVAWLQSLLVIPAPSPPPDGVVADPLEVSLATYPEHWREAWRITRGLILLLRREVEARGARLAVVVINAREEISPAHWAWARSHRASLKDAACDLDKPTRLITGFLARRGIPAIPLLDEFRARFSADATPGFFAWDVHWAPAGHELAATVIERRLRELGLVVRRGHASLPAAAVRASGRRPEPP